MAGVNFNPMVVTNAPGTFFASSGGAVSGCLEPDPSARYAIDQGMNQSGSSAVLYGGMAVAVSSITPGTEVPSVRSVLTIAGSQAAIGGFTVFDQSAALLQTPQSPVPVAPTGGFINFVRLGSGARLWVPCSSADAASFQGGAENQACYWDYVNQVLLHGASGTAIGVKITDVNVGGLQAPSYNSGTGFYTWNYAASGVCILI